jgi:hypothetical protein
MGIVEQKLAGNGHAKTVHTYTLPEGIRNGGPTKVGIVQLSADQELLASKMGNFNFTKTQYAAVKLSIVSFDGRPVDHDSVESFFDGADARIRSLLLQAYNKMTSPSRDDEDSFFKSEEIQVG